MQLIKGTNEKVCCLHCRQFVMSTLMSLCLWHPMTTNTNFHVVFAVRLGRRATAAQPKFQLSLQSYGQAGQFLLPVVTGGPMIFPRGRPQGDTKYRIH